MANHMYTGVCVLKLEYHVIVTSRKNGRSKQYEKRQRNRLFLYF